MGRRAATDEDRRRNVEFGNWLRKQRQRHEPKLTIEVAAARSGVTLHHYTKIENGSTGTRPATAVRIAEAVGADPKVALEKAGFVPTDAYLVAARRPTEGFSAPAHAAGGAPGTAPEEEPRERRPQEGRYGTDYQAVQADAPPQMPEYLRSLRILAEQLLAQINAATHPAHAGSAPTGQSDAHTPVTETLALPPAQTDALTGLLARGMFERRLHGEVERAKRRARLLPLSLVVLDVDGLGRLNAAAGSASGDAVLADIAATIQAQMRSYDFAGRAGGDEFLVALPQTEGEEALYVSDRYHESIQVAPWNTHGVTVSLGVSTLTSDMQDEAALITQTYLALYYAKRRGDCVIDLLAVIGERSEAEIFGSAQKRLPDARIRYSSGGGARV